MTALRRISLTLLVLLVHVGAAQVLVTTGLSEMVDLRPGEVERLAIGVTNAGGEPRTAAIRFSDYQIVDSEDRFLAPGSLGRSLATWIVSPPTVNLGAGESTTVLVDVQAPTEMQLGGTYWGVIFIEPDDAIDPIDDPSLGTEDGEGEDVTIRFRYRIRSAIQVVANLPGSERPQLVLRNPRVTRTQEEAIALRIDLINEGGRWARSSTMMLDVYDTQTGAKVSSRVEQVARLYPGSSRRISSNAGRLDPGRYHLVLLVETGGDVVAATRFDLNVGSIEPSTPTDEAP